MDGKRGRQRDPDYYEGDDYNDVVSLLYAPRKPKEPPTLTCDAAAAFMPLA